MLAATTVALCCNFASTAYSANVAIRDNDRGLIDLEGVIAKSDVPKFAELVRLVVSRQDKNWTVRLNSPGGDVLAAMEIGMMVRKEWMRTWSSSSRFAFANPPRLCASACVLILAAGARRSATEDSIGIHRPRFDEQLFAGLDAYQAQVKYEQMSQVVRAYLNKMGMPDQLFHEMMKIPSSKVKMLSEQEIKNFSLQGVDPAYAEWNRARGIARWGEQRFKEYEDWADRLDAFVDRCVASAPKNTDVGQRFTACYDEFLRRYPNPFPDNPG